MSPTEARARDGSGTSERPDVTVVGGGLAGLACGLALAEEGLRVVVLERNELLGGRARSWTDDTTGDPVHIGPHVLMSDYVNMLELMQRLGTGDRVSWLEHSFIDLVDGRERHPIRSHRLLPAPLHLLPSVSSDPAVSQRDVLSNTRVTALAMALDEAALLQLDAVNALGFLLGMGVTRRYVDRFWRFVAMSVLNVPLEVCSAGALMRIFRRMLGRPDLRFGFPRGGLGDLFAPAARERIEALGGRVETGVRVSALEGEGDVLHAVRLADGRRLEPRFCVAALTPQALRPLLPHEWPQRHAVFGDLASFHPCPYISAYLWFDRRLTRLPFWARVHRPNDYCCDFYDFRNIAGTPAGEGSLIGTNVIYSHRAGELSDDAIEREVRRELAEFLPESARARGIHRVVNRIPMAIHCPFPGTERLRPDVRSPVSGLHLAGDWTATGTPSSMESAVRSGWLAAEAVLRDAGRPRTWARDHPEVRGLTRLWTRTCRLAPPLRAEPRWLKRLAASAAPQEAVR